MKLMWPPRSHQAVEKSKRGSFHGGLSESVFLSWGVCKAGWSSEFYADRMLSFAFAGLPEILLTRMVDDAGRKRLGFALGNALPANTVERLLCRVLYIANLVQSPLIVTSGQRSCLIGARTRLGSPDVVVVAVVAVVSSSTHQ